MEKEDSDLEIAAKQSVQLPSEAMAPSREGLCHSHVTQGCLWNRGAGQQVEAEKDESVVPGSWSRPLANSQKQLGDVFERDSFLSSEVRSGRAYDMPV